MEYIREVFINCGFPSQEIPISTFVIEYKGNPITFNINKLSYICVCINFIENTHFNVNYYDPNYQYDGYIMRGGAPIVDLTLPAGKVNNERLVYVLY